MEKNNSIFEEKRQDVWRETTGRFISNNRTFHPLAIKPGTLSVDVFYDVEVPHSSLFHKYPITVFVRTDTLNDRSIQIFDMPGNGGTTSMDKCSFSECGECRLSVETKRIIRLLSEIREFGRAAESGDSDSFG